MTKMSFFCQIRFEKDLPGFALYLKFAQQSVFAKKKFVDSGLPQVDFQAVAEAVAVGQKTTAFLAVAEAVAVGQKTTAFLAVDEAVAVGKKLLVEAVNIQL